MRVAATERFEGGHSSACRRARGVTMIEMLVALPLAAVIIGYLAYYVQNTVRVYDFEESKSDMVQNAHYAAQRLSEVLAETGACLPNLTDDIMLYDSTGSSPPMPVITRRYNPECNAIFTIPASAVAKDSIWVDTLGEYFLKVDSIVVAYNKTLVRWRRPIIAVVDSPNTARADTIVIDAQDDVVRKDVIYGYKTETWSVTPQGQLYIYTTNSADTSMILAENLDTIQVRFYDKLDTAEDTPIWNWKDIEHGTVYVVARTERGAPGSGDTLRQSYFTRFRFKSKVEE